MSDDDAKPTFKVDQKIRVKKTGELGVVTVVSPGSYHDVGVAHSQAGNRTVQREYRSDELEPWPR